MRTDSRVTYSRTVTLEPSDEPVRVTLPSSLYSTRQKPFDIFLREVTQTVTRDGGPGHEYVHAVSVSGRKVKTDGGPALVDGGHTFRGDEKVPDALAPYLLPVTDLLKQA